MIGITINFFITKVLGASVIFFRNVNRVPYGLILVDFFLLIMLKIIIWSSIMLVYDPAGVTAPEQDL